MTGEQDAWPADCEKLTMEVQSMPGSAKEAKGLHSRLVQVEELSRTKAQKMCAKRRVCKQTRVKQACFKLGGHTARIAHGR